MHYLNSDYLRYSLFLAPFSRKHHSLVSASLKSKIILLAPLPKERSGGS